MGALFAPTNLGGAGGGGDIGQVDARPILGDPRAESWGGRETGAGGKRRQREKGRGQGEGGRENSFSPFSFSLRPLPPFAVVSRSPHDLPLSLPGCTRPCLGSSVCPCAHYGRCDLHCTALIGCPGHVPTIPNYELIALFFKPDTIILRRVNDGGGFCSVKADTDFNPKRPDIIASRAAGQRVSKPIWNSHVPRGLHLS